VGALVKWRDPEEQSCLHSNASPHMPCHFCVEVWKSRSGLHIGWYDMIPRLVIVTSAGVLRRRRHEFHTNIACMRRHVDFDCYGDEAKAINNETSTMLRGEPQRASQTTT
jgi:hypothetical protein